MECGNKDRIVSRILKMRQNEVERRRILARWPNMKTYRWLKGGGNMCLCRLPRPTEGGVNPNYASMQVMTRP